MTVDKFGYAVCPTCNGEHHVDDAAAWARCGQTPPKAEEGDRQ